MNTIQNMQRREVLKTSTKVLGGALALNMLGGGTVFANTLANTPQIPLVTLNNGIKMPILGYGTLKLGNQKETQKAVEEALEVGYRLLDTAQSYLNEEGVGYAIKATIKTRNLVKNNT